MFAASDSGVIDRPGGVFARRRDLLSAEVVGMLRATARVHVPCDGRSPGRILEAAMARGPLPKDAPAAIPTQARVSERAGPPALRARLRVVGDTSGRSFSSPAPAAPTRTESSGDGATRFENGFGDLIPGGDYEIRVAGDH